MGVYYFSSTNIYDHGNWLSASVDVDGDKFIRETNRKLSAIQMNVKAFWIGPGKVYVDFEQPLYDSENYELAMNKYVFRGCTLLLCQLPVTRSSDYKQQFESFKKSLSSLIIDHMIVPRIPLYDLRHEHIRFFGRKKVPFIIVDVTSLDKLYEVKWEWVEEAQSFSRVPIVCISSNTQVKTKDLIKLWDKISKSYHIHTLTESITEYPLSKEILRLTGISPYKGEYFPYGAADYNLFEQTQMPAIDEQTNFRYHKAIPVITVMKGQLVKINQLIHSDVGIKGNYIQVSIPRHFLT